MPSWMLILVSIFLSIVFSAFFSGAEIAFTSLNRLRLRSRAEKGDKKAARLHRFLKKPEKFLNTSLVGNNLALVAGSSLTAYFFTHIISIQISHVVIDILLFTPLVLVFGEIIPKLVFREFNETLSRKVYPLLRFFYYLFWPLNLLLELVVIFLLKITGIPRNRNDMQRSRSDLIRFLDQVDREGLLKNTYIRVLKKWLLFSRSTAEEKMIPRTKLEAIGVGASFSELLDAVIRSEWERLPVFDGNLDNIDGFIRSRDLIDLAENRESVSIAKVLRKVTYVPESRSCQDLLKVMINKREQMVVVIDEYGGTAGVVTLDLLLEGLTAFLDSERSIRTPYAKKLRENTFIFDSGIDAGEVEQIMDLKLKNGEFVSLGGCILEKLHRIPRKGEIVDLGEARAVILSATSRKIGYVRVER